MFLIGIEAVRWLIHNQDFGIVNDCLRKTGPMPIAFGQRLYGLMHDWFEKTHLDRALDCALLRFAA